MSLDADFLVLAGDFMTIAGDEIFKLRPMATYVGRRKVQRRTQMPPPKQTTSSSRKAATAAMGQKGLVEHRDGAAGTPVSRPFEAAYIDVIIDTNRPLPTTTGQR